LARVHSGENVWSTIMNFAHRSWLYHFGQVRFSLKDHIS
jgi:hypothetical protein